MEQIYNEKMRKIGYSQFVCDIFPAWEEVKDEILPKDRKTGTGKGTIHVYLENFDMAIGQVFKDYYESVKSGNHPDINAIKIKHFFSINNLICQIGYACKYFFDNNKSLDVVKYLTILKEAKITENGLVSTESLFKLSTQYRPYFKQFDSDGLFHKLIRELLLPKSAYKISLYKNEKDEYAAFWLIGFNDVDNFEVNAVFEDNKSDKLKKQINSVIDYSFYRTYLSSIKSKPFLLLAGISGTGKSRIVRELARACWEVGTSEYEAHKPKNFEMIQVKPNWHDSSELIGYLSNINGTRFIAGKFLEFVVKAWSEPEKPYFLCLDEMNLAPVEQYFAEYLSVIESRKLENGRIVTDAILSPDKQYSNETVSVNYNKLEESWYVNLINDLLVKTAAPEDIQNNLRVQFKKDGITIPQNLIVVGTVNMDETTFSFSRKVLDRAMTIEMNEVDLLGGLENKHEKIGLIGKNELIGNYVEGSDVYSSYKEVCDKALDYLKAINDKLEGTPFKVAYRTRNEFLLYVVNNLSYKQDEKGNNLPENFIIARALDEITNMKILSRIEGDETKVKSKFLDDLNSVISAKLAEISEDYIFVSKLDELKETDTTEDGRKMYASVSMAKLDEMKKRLESGYTSFWS